MSRKLPNGLTAQQEEFAQLLAKGVAQKVAYLQAGYRGKEVDSLASHLASKPQVVARVAEIMGSAARSVSVDLAYVIGGLKEISDYGRSKVPIVTIDGDVVGEKVADASAANRALELLGKHLGAFIDRSQIELSDGTRKHIEALVRIVAEEVHDPDTMRRIVERIGQEMR